MTTGVIEALKTELGVSRSWERGTNSYQKASDK